MMRTNMRAVAVRLLDQLGLVRRYLKSRAPFVRRREYRLMQRRYETAVDALTFDHLPAGAVRLDVVKPLAVDGAMGDVCLFVTYADRPCIGAHVIHHVAALVDQGVKVVLIINTDFAQHEMELDAATVARASAVYVRENSGFDFAAWGHAYTLAGGLPDCQRLLLVNDSIVGPLSAPDYAQLIARVRGSAADVVGLTENFRPAWHMQSFFLVFNARVLADARFKRLFAGILAFKDKGTVITAYELPLARQLSSMGFRCETLFPARFHDERSGDDTLGNWQALLDAGFPFVKGAIVRNTKQAAAVAARVPAPFIASLTGRRHG